MYWRYHDLIFDREGELENGSFVAFANALNLNISEFNTCLSSNETLSEVEKYKSDAIEVGIYGTPTFIFGDKSLVGPQSYKNLEKFVT
jgi:protein-disulfide isomerase